MLRVASALLCTLLLLASLSPAAAAVGGGTTAQMAGEGSLTLSVGDDEGALSDARVVVRQQGSMVLSGRTGADGTLSTGPLSEGTYEVTVVKRGYHAQSFSIAVDGDESRSVTLDPGSVDLTLRVADERTGKSLADATIDAGDVGTVTTGPDGTQTVRTPVNSQVDLTISKAGYRTETLSVAVGESPTQVAASMARESNVSLSVSTHEVDAGDSVTVHASDAYGDSLANASVLLDGEAVASTNGDGDAEVTLNESGDHTLRVRAGTALSDAETVHVEGDSFGTTPTPTANGTASENETANRTQPTATESGDGFDETATETPESSDSGFALPRLGDKAGPLGLVPPIEGRLRIVLVIGAVGLVGLVFSALSSHDG